MSILFLIVSYLLTPPYYGSLCNYYDDDFDEYRYQEDIPHCRRNVSTQKKDEICIRDGIRDRSNFTVDHIIPLALGGSNKDDNLWCQHYSLNKTKLEYKLYLMLREGDITHDEAIERILDAKFTIDREVWVR